MCKFVDDSQSAFPLEVMNRCRVDAIDKWRDFNGLRLRPFGNGEVAIGYDPQESSDGDDAALVVIALPQKKGDKFRVLEKHRLKGGFEAQAEAIFRQMARYNVVDVGIDTTGVGAAVYQLVAKRFPAARAIQYSAPFKAMMVFKARSVIMAGRLQYDCGDKDITASFMSIRPQLTGSQRAITYVASRAGDTGHADVAWAVMHVLITEPLDGELDNKTASGEMF